MKKFLGFLIIIILWCDIALATTLHFKRNRDNYAMFIKVGVIVNGNEIARLKRGAYARYNVNSNFNIQVKGAGAAGLLSGMKIQSTRLRGQANVSDRYYIIGIGQDVIEKFTIMEVSKNQFDSVY